MKFYCEKKAFVRAMRFYGDDEEIKSKIKEAKDFIGKDYIKKWKIRFDEDFLEKPVIISKDIVLRVEWGDYLVWRVYDNTFHSATRRYFEDLYWNANGTSINPIDDVYNQGG